jgi:hypothetical protein
MELHLILKSFHNLRFLNIQDANNIFMNRVLFITLSSLFFANTTQASDEYVNGVYTTINNVTLPCKILIPKDFGHFNAMSLFSKVTIVDSIAGKKKYRPNEISGFSFTYQSKKYTYASIQVEDDGTKMFLWPLNLGKKINEYYYYTTNSSGTDKGSSDAGSEIYVLEDAETKETITLTRGGTLTDNFRTRMRRFFENDKQLLTLLARDVKNFHDISKFVIDANK